MLEVQEVFRLATQKVRPDPGFIDRQHELRRKQERRRKIGAFAVVTAIVLAAVALIVRWAPHERQSQPAVTGPLVTVPVPEAVDPIERPSGRRLSRIVEGVPFSFTLPPYGWERFGTISLNKSAFGPQGAEGIIFWTSFPDGRDHDPCATLLRPQVGPSAVDLAAAVSTAPGTMLVAGPSDVTIGGHPAKHVVLTVREDVGCHPGFFFTWEPPFRGGAMWDTTEVGDTIRIWIVDVEGTRLFIEAETHKDAGLGLKREIQRIVESIRFN